MNPFQAVWWRQVRADHEVLLLLRRSEFAPCHQLHYIQMVTEKLGKAYFWRDGRPPRLDHLSFSHFLKTLAGRRDSGRVASLFGFGDERGFTGWVRATTPTARDLERLAPALANDGPNPEYPWPHGAPRHAPVAHDFSLWAKLKSGRGRQLLKVVDDAVARFPEYA